MGTTTLLKWKLRKGSLWRTKFTPHLTRWEYGMTWRRGVRSMVAFYLQPPTQEIIAFPTQGTRAVGHFGNSLFLRNTLGIPSKARFVGRSAFLTGGRDARGLYKSHRPQRPHCFILRFGIWNSTGPVTPIWRQCEAASGSGDEQGSFRTCKACATAWTIIFFTCSHEEVKTKLSVAAHISCGKPNLLVEVVSLLAHSFIRDDGFDPLSKLPEMMVLIHYLSYSVGKGLQSFPIATRARLMI